MKRVLLLILLASLATLAGCANLVSSASTTTKYFDDQGRQTKEITTSGPVEAQAAAGQAALAEKAIQQMSGLTTRVEIPRGYDQDGKPLPPATLTVVDSAVYAAMAKLADLSGYQSPERAMFDRAAKVAEKATPWGFTYAIVDAVVSKGTGTQTRYDNSFNGNNNSPVQAHNGFGSEQSANLTDSHDSTDDHSSQVGETPAQDGQ